MPKIDLNVAVNFEFEEDKIRGKSAEIGKVIESSMVGPFIRSSAVVKEFKNFLRAIGTSKLEKLIKETAAFHQEMTLLNVEQNLLKEMTREVAEETREQALAMLKSGEAVGNLNSLVDQGILSMEGILDIYHQNTIAISKLRGGLVEVTDGLDQNIVFWGDARRAVEAHGDSLKKIDGNFTVVKQAIEQNKNMMNTFSISTDLATSAMHGLSPALKDVGDVTKESGGIVKEATGQIDELKKKAGLVASPLEVMTGNFSGLSDIAEEVRKPLGQTSDLFDLVGSSGTTANEVLETFGFTLLDVRSSLDDVIQSLTGYGQNLDQLVGKQGLLTDAIGETVTGFNDLKTVLGLTTTAYDTHVNSVDKTKTALETLIEKLNDTKTAIDTVNQTQYPELKLAA